MKDTQYLFILGNSNASNDKENLVLDPFASFEAFKDRKSILEGRYSGDIPNDNIENIRQSLYTSLEKNVRRYFLEKSYYWRFILSALAFLVVYLFMSIVIRDPIPLFDEIIASVAAAVFSYIYIGKKILSKNQYAQNLVDMRKSIDCAFFSESRLLDVFDIWRTDALVSGPNSFFKVYDEKYDFTSEELEEAESLCSQLVNRWAKISVVSDFYKSVQTGLVTQKSLKKLYRKLGSDEASIVLAYLKLLPYVLNKESN